MTSRLLRKPRTTARGRWISAPRAFEWAGLALLLLSGVTSAQAPVPTIPVPLGPPRALPVPLISTPPAPSPSVQPARFQPAAPPPTYAPAQKDQMISLDPPGQERVLILDSEAMLFQRWQQQAKDREPPEKLIFPEEPILSKDAYRGRSWPQRTLFAEPNYVIYERLMFEEVNAERYGWDLGILGPVVSSGAFFKDLVLFPYHCGTDPCRKYDSNAGLCLPGDPVPYRLYPEGASLTGALYETAAVLTLIAIFP